MNIVAGIFKELIGLFVDDGSLALAILAVVAVVAALMAIGLPPIAGGPLLFLLCAGVVVENVLRTLRAKRR